MQNAPPPNPTIDKLKTRLDRERKSRKAAEKLLEDKSREVFIANETLKKEIQEREKIQQDLAIAVAEARELTRLKSEFVTNMSHEIRTPLNGIIGLSQLLFDTPLDDEQREYLDEINSSSQLLLDIAEDVLDLSNLESDHLAVQNAPFSTRSFFRDTKEYTQEIAIDSDLAVSCEIADSVPSKIISDKKLLERSLKCILDNAVKFTNAGSIAISVTAEIKSRTIGELQIAVQDTGSGIPEDAFGRIFQSFSQVDASLTRNHEGTGLGLTISKQLIELMGGEIQVESELGVGSTFTLVIPFEQEQIFSRADLVPPGEPCSVLIVDDNKINQKVAGKLFKRIGCEPEIANCGVEALQSLHTHKIDVMFIDMQMPGIDGVETIQRVHTELGNGRPCIIAMHVDQEEFGEEVLKELGIEGSIKKPMRFDNLLEVLKRAKETTRLTNIA